MCGEESLGLELFVQRRKHKTYLIKSTICSNAELEDSVHIKLHNAGPFGYITGYHHRFSDFVKTYRSRGRKSQLRKKIIRSKTKKSIERSVSQAKIAEQSQTGNPVAQEQHPIENKPQKWKELASKSKFTKESVYVRRIQDDEGSITLPSSRAPALDIEPTPDVTEHLPTVKSDDYRARMQRN